MHVAGWSVSISNYYLQSDSSFIQWHFNSKLPCYLHEKFINRVNNQILYNNSSLQPSCHNVASRTMKVFPRAGERLVILLTSVKYSVCFVWPLWQILYLFEVWRLVLALQFDYCFVSDLHFSGSDVDWSDLVVDVTPISFTYQQRISSPFSIHPLCDKEMIKIRYPSERIDLYLVFRFLRLCNTQNWILNRAYYLEKKIMKRCFILNYIRCASLCDCNNLIS